LTRALRAELKLDADAHGVLVLEVAPASDAALKGLRRAHIISSVNDHPIRNLDDFRRARDGATDTIQLTLRSGKKIDFALPAASHRVTSR
jgi:S1-C subfamily serine protease